MAINVASQLNNTHFERKCIMGARQSTVNRFPGSYPEDSGDTDFSSSEMTLRRVARRPSVPSDSEFAHSTDISSSSMSKRRAFSESDTLALGERDRSRLNQNRKRKPGCEEILCWKENFSSLLSHPIGYELFLLFLKEEHSEESILFWRACEEFKRSSFRVSAKARRLYRTFVKVDSQHEVNLDYRERRKIEEALKSPKKSIFDEAQRKVIFMMMNDPYPRFLKSSIYLNLERKSLEA